MKRTIFLIYLSMIMPLFSTIIEISHFNEILSYVHNDTLILIDIDDTILIAPQMLGTDAWLNYRTEQRRKAGMDSLEAFKKSLAEWEAIRHITNMELVEANTDKIIRSLQADGYPIMGLTTQGITLSGRTSHQLKTHQIDLSLSSPVEENHCLKIQRHNVFFIDGILYTTGVSKAESFFALSEKIGYFP